MKFLFIALLSVVAYARADAIETYTYLFKGKTVSVPIGKIGDTRFNDVCINGQDHCEALQAYKSPAKKATHLGVETYASDYCALVGGTSLLLTSPRQSGALFCVFKDLSMVDARALASSAWKEGGKH